MNSDFDPNSHKNLELLRYYLNRDLTRIDQNIQNSSNELLGYFIASLVDMSVVVLFSDLLSGKGVRFKLFAVFALIVLFVIVSKVSNKVANWISTRRKESGREEYLIDAAKQAIIDDFDNIACDALLICEEYMQRYQAAEKEHIKNFYLYEIIHHLTKSVDLFNEIDSHQDWYISSQNSELIDSYRINNYIDYAKAINQFLCNEIQKPISDPELKKDLDNLNASISKWTYIS